MRRERGIGFWFVVAVAVGVAIPTIVNMSVDDPFDALMLSLKLLVVASVVCGILAFMR